MKEKNMERPIEKSDRILATLISLGPFFGTFIIPLIIFLLKRKESRLIDCTGREVINAQINAIILIMICLAVGGLMAGPNVSKIGLVIVSMAPVIALVYTISFIIGAVKAYNGECLQYPVVFKFLVKRNL